MTQVGEDPEAMARPVMTFGATTGEILADRYRLEEQVDDDSGGRQIWRGADVVLRRPVAVVLRYPGGESAADMLNSAVAASRVAHANLVGVYDAIDEGHRAYVVREWVDGVALRDYLGESPLPPDRATTVGHAVASAVAAVHATDMVHGNVHPGTVLIGADGRVVLADGRGDGEATPEADIRAVGGVLYFALTGRWPHAELPSSRVRQLPDAVRDSNGTLSAPHQVRAGVPGYLDELTRELLDSRVPVPSAQALAAELGRLDAEAEAEAAMRAPFFDSEGPLGLGSAPAAEPARPAGRKIALGVVALLLVAAAGLFLSTRFLAPADADGPGPQSNATAGPPSTRPTEGGAKSITLTADQVRVVDPGGDRTELAGVEKVVDRDLDTGWETDTYNNNAKFGLLKPGMGIWVDLGEEQRAQVEVVLSTAGASAQLRTGTTDLPATKEGDEQMVASYRVVQEYTEHNGTKMVFNVEQPARYLLLWITSMPEVEEARYQIGVQEIMVTPR